MYVYVVRTCIRCGTNVYLGGTKMGGMKRRWYEKTGYHEYSYQQNYESNSRLDKTTGTSV